MELLPYVDVTQVQEPDVLDRVFFMDYRTVKDLKYGCDPLLEGPFHDYMTPDTIALTRSGASDRNFDNARTMMYYAEKNAIRVHDGEMFIANYEDRMGKYDDWSGVGIFSVGVQATKGLFHQDFLEWFDAPSLLTRFRDAYQTGKSSPWETSFPDGDGWRVDGKNITALLRKNGWPDSFNADQFRVDLIRAQNKPSGLGYAEVAFKSLDDLQGNEVKHPEFPHNGEIAGARRFLISLEKDLERSKNSKERLRLAWVIHCAKREIERYETELLAAKKDIQRLCPNDTCIAPQDMILWEYRAIEKEYTKAQAAANTTVQCQRKMNDLPTWAPPDSHRFNNCIARLDLEQHWLNLAYHQTQSEARAHCARTNISLLPPDTLELRATAQIAAIERRRAQLDEESRELLVWLEDMDVSEMEKKALWEWRPRGGGGFLTLRLRISERRWGRMEIRKSFGDSWISKLRGVYPRLEVLDTIRGLWMYTAFDVCNV
jgi:hypothetical protein